MGDEAIEEIYTIAKDCANKVMVFILPQNKPAPNTEFEAIIKFCITVDPEPTKTFSPISTFPAMVAPGATWENSPIFDP